MGGPVIIVQQGSVLAAGAFGCQGTFTYQNVIDAVREFVHGIPVTTVDSQVAHIINAAIWYAYPWKWTVNTLTQFSLTDNVQDYANVPADYHLMLQCRITRTDATPDQVVSTPDMATHLEPDYQKVDPTAIVRVSFEPSITSFRFDHPPKVATGATYVVDGEYQKTCPKITDAELSNTMCQPDCYFNVMLEGVKWKFYQLSDDQRAGTVVVNSKGQKQYAGQLGVFHDALQAMVMGEDLADESQFQFPDTALGVTTRSTNLLGSAWS